MTTVFLLALVPGAVPLQAGEICAGLAPTTAVTAKDCPPPSLAALPEAAGSPTAVRLPRWGRGVLMVSAGGVLVEVVLHGLHGGGSWLGLGALAGGWLWVARSEASGGQPLSPRSVAGWSERCHGLLGHFAQLDPDPASQHQRTNALQALLSERERQDLRVALVSADPPADGTLAALRETLRGPRPLRLLVSHPLPSSSSRWQWSEGFAACDALIYHLRPPLTAADLRWLEALPADLPIWLLVQTGPQRTPEAWLGDLRSQWPRSTATPILPWAGADDGLGTSLAPLCLWLGRESARLPKITLQRSLETLHQSWQADLERLRRVQWRQLQRRTQWLVAAGVLLTPSLSVDLLVVTVANGLMLREMARLWDCPWSLEQLKAAATQVGQAALGLGVVEWSTQAFCAAFKLHGATWLVGGSLQALSAAYLTRVIGHAMADLLARSVGVSAPDLEAIKAEAPLLVARAAESERLDWASFLQEASVWLRQQAQGQGSPATLPGAAPGV